MPGIFAGHIGFTKPLWLFNIGWIMQGAKLRFRYTKHLHSHQNTCSELPKDCTVQRKRYRIYRPLNIIGGRGLTPLETTDSDSKTVSIAWEKK